MIISIKFAKNVKLIGVKIALLIIVNVKNALMDFILKMENAFMIQHSNSQIQNIFQNRMLFLIQMCSHFLLNFLNLQIFYLLQGSQNLMNLPFLFILQVLKFLHQLIFFLFLLSFLNLQIFFLLSSIFSFSSQFSS